MEVLQKTVDSWAPKGTIVGLVLLQVNTLLLFFPSYLALLMLNYGDRMEKSQMAHHQAEEEGLSFRVAERVVELELFLDESPQWGLGTPHLVSYSTRDVPTCRSMGAKRGRMYVPLRLPKQHKGTQFPRWTNLPWGW